MKNKILTAISAWLALIRLPNLFTVPCDPLSAFLLGGGKIFSPSLIPIFISSLSLYTFGLITNDIHDLNEDKNTRPDRPLPSGKIKPSIAKFAAFLLATTGIISSYYSNSKFAFIISIALLSAIILYNFFLKDNPILAPLLLAICRILNLLLGLSILATFPSMPQLLSILYLMAIYFMFIMGISICARKENNSDIYSFSIGALFILFSITFLTIVFAQKFFFVFRATKLIAPAFISGFIALPILIFFFCSLLYKRLILRNSQISLEIGKLICSIILLHTAYLSANAFYYESIIIFCLFPISIIISTRFKSS